LLDQGSECDYDNDASNHFRDLERGEVTKGAFDYRDDEITKCSTEDS